MVCHIRVLRITLWLHYSFKNIILPWNPGEQIQICVSAKRKQSELFLQGLLKAEHWRRKRLLLLFVDELVNELEVDENGGINKLTGISHTSP